MTTQDAGLCPDCLRLRAGFSDHVHCGADAEARGDGSGCQQQQAECYRLGYERLKAELATARAEERAKALEEAAMVASLFSVKPDRNIHPDVPWDAMGETAKMVTHTTAQQIAWEIRELASVPLEAGPIGPNALLEQQLAEVKGERDEALARIDAARSELAVLGLNARYVTEDVAVLTRALLPAKQAEGAQPQEEK